MYTGDVLGIALIAIGLIAAATAFQVLVAAVFTTRVDAASRCVGTRPYISTLAGLLVLGAWFVAALVAGQVPGPGKAIAAVLGLALIVFALFGWAAASRIIGERLPSPADTPWRATLRGAVASATFGIVVPFLGWFLILPLVLAAGAGGVFLSFLRPESPPPLPREAEAPLA